MNISPYTHVFQQQIASRRTSRPENCGSPERQHSPEISRLLTAAVVNQAFRELLLTEPVQALAQGFNGEEFALSSHERQLVLSIRAKTVQGFAAQLLSAAHSPGTETSFQTEERYEKDRKPIRTHPLGVVPVPAAAPSF